VARSARGNWRARLQLGQFQSGVSWAGSAGPRENREMEGKKEKLVEPGSASIWVSAHCQIGTRKSFSFSNLFIICKLI
jgi:hypothetical protein